MSKLISERPLNLFKNDAGALVQWLKLPAWKVEFQRKCFFPAPLPRGNVLNLRPPGLLFQIMCLDGSVISPSHGPV